MSTIDIPTAVTEREREMLQRLAFNREVLEVGSLLGHSTVALAQVARHVTSVDPHVGYPADNPRPTLPTFVANLKRYRVRDKVSIVVTTHDKAFPVLSRRFCDFVFIDATGEEELTFDIMRRALPLMKSYGYMAVHDCGHPDWPGAMDAVTRFKKVMVKDRQIATFKLIDRMAVIGFRGLPNWVGE